MLLAEDAPTVVNAGTGREALEFLKEHTPHLVILAFELPDIGGDVVCGKIKSVSRLARVPTILTIEPPGRTGIPHDVRDRARAVGADLLLQKPLGDKNLRDRVRQLLARWDTAGTGVGRSTKNTIVIEEALDALGTPGDDGAMPASDPVTDALYRENEELRQELASLKRRLARLEAGLGGRDDAGEAEQTIVTGSEPSAPAEPAPAEPVPGRSLRRSAGRSRRRRAGGLHRGPGASRARARAPQQGATGCVGRGGGPERRSAARALQAPPALSAVVPERGRPPLRSVGADRRRP